MKKIIKRILSAALTGVLLLSGNSLNTYAAETQEEQADQDSVLEDGAYVVPLSVSARADQESASSTWDKYHTALIQVQDGKTNVTLRIGSMKSSKGNKTVKVLKEKYTASDIGFTASSIADEVWDNEEYWRGDDEVTKTDNATYGWEEITFPVNDLTQPIILGTENYPGNQAKGNICTLAYTQAVKLPEIKDGTYTWSYVLDNSFVSELKQGSTSQTGNKTFKISTEISEILKEDVQVSISEDVATATFQLTETAQEQLTDPKVYYADKDENQTKSNGYTWLIQSANSSYQEVEIKDNGTFTMTFDLTNYRDMVFGPVVKIMYQENSKENYDKWLFGTLRLSESSVKSITLTDETTGIQFLTTTANVSETDKLQVTELTQGDDYDKWASYLDNTSKSWKAYDVKVVGTDGTERALSNTGTLKIPLPSGWSENTTGMYINSNAGAKVTGTQSMGYVVIDSTKLTEQYALRDPLSSESTAEDLSDGVYKVQWYLELLGESGASMSDGAFKKPATVTVKDGTVRVEFEQQGVTVGGVLGYLSKAMILSDKGEYETVTTTKYMRDSSDDDSLYSGQNIAGRYVYYPYISETFYIESDQTHNGDFTMKFRVPLMDGLADADSGVVGGMEKEAHLVIDYSTAELVQDETAEAAPVDTVLSEAITVAEDMTEHWQEYTAQGWSESNIENALADAKTAQSGDDSGKWSAYEALQSAIDILTDNYLSGKAYAQGLYTTNVSLTESIESSGDTFAEISQGRFFVKDNDETIVQLDTENIEALEYYDIYNRKYVAAEAKKDEDGNITGFTYTLAPVYKTSTEHAENVYESIGIRYKMADGETYENCWLNLTEIQVATVDIAELDAKLATAQELIEGSGWDEKKIASLEEVMAEAAAVKTDPMTVQSDIDAMTEKVAAAIDAVLEDIDANYLEEKITAAETEAAKTDHYTKASLAALNTAIEEAKELLSGGSASNDEIYAKGKELDAKLAGLVEKADTTTLRETLETAAAIENDNYSGWNDLQDVIVKAQEVLNNEDASQTEVNDMVNALVQAMTMLDDTVDKSGLRETLEQAEGLMESTTDTTWANASESDKAYVESVLAAAKAVLEDGAASQSEVTKMENALVDIWNAMAEPMTQSATGLYDGTYAVDVNVTQPNGSSSMANGAIEEAQIVVKDGIPTSLRLHFKALTTSLGSEDFTGHLGRLWYYATTSSTVPTSGEIAATVESTTDETDDYISQMNGEKYPEWISIPILTYQENGTTQYQTSYWIKVFVPVMEDITAGTGTQNAKLTINLDAEKGWYGMEQLTGTDTDKDSLNTAISALQAIKEEIGESDANNEYMQVLASAITAGQAVADNLNSSQTKVDKTVTALNTTATLFETQTVQSDKSTLKELIESARVELERDDISYTETSANTLKTMLDAAEAVYNNAAASQDQVNSWITRVQNALDNLTKAGADRAELKEILAETEERLADKSNYTAAELEILERLYNEAKELFENAKTDLTISQQEVDAEVDILKTYMESMTKVTETETEKSGLHAMLMTASNIAGRENVYSESTLNALKAAIKTAETVYEDKDATQTEINAQVTALYNAILDLTLRDDISTGGNNNGGNNDGNNDGNGDDSQNEEETPSTLDRYNLADGVYSITGTMVKTDGTSQSMSDNAINHTIKLTVENGKYYITMDFKGLKVGTSYGYLKDLKYFLSGYTKDNYGTPLGDTEDVTVESYQQDENGDRISDNFGTDYPDVVTFELIDEALEDGYVPLQVFVPIMESIAEGNGTQAVYLKLDWASLKMTSEDDPNFTDDGSNNNNTDDGNDGNTLTGGSGLTGGSSLTGGSTLGNSSLGGSSLGGSSLGGSSLGSSSLNSGSGLSSASSVKTDDTSTDARALAALLAIGCMALAAGLVQRRMQKKDSKIN